MRFSDAVWGVVTRIPAGRVATYGQIAGLLHRPRSARAVGAAMRGCPASLPWHRVVNVRGGISRRARVGSMLTQQILLEREGVRLRRGRVPLVQYRWAPREGRDEAGAAPELLRTDADARPRARPRSRAARLRLHLDRRSVRL